VGRLPGNRSAGRSMAANSPSAAGGKSGSRPRSIIACRAIPAKVARSPFELGINGGDPADSGAGDPGRIAVELWNELVFLVD
jgi:hypothetical protein